MRELGLVQFLTAKIQAPIILTMHAPNSPNYEFKAFYNLVRDKGFILYPGKLTQAETFNIGCIGAMPSVRTKCGSSACDWRCVKGVGNKDKERGQLLRACC